MIAARSPQRLDFRSTTDLINTNLVVSNSPTLEFLICQIEIPGPIRRGEIWDMFGEVAAENTQNETAGVFIRTEIWVVPEPGEPQYGIRSQLNTQSASFNLGNQGQFAVLNRQGSYEFNEYIMSPQWLKLFSGSGSTQSLTDSIVRYAYLGLKRTIPNG